MFHVLTLSTLFPDITRPNFGVFVERQTLGLAALPDVDLRVVAPIGMPPFPLNRLDRYRTRDAAPLREVWKGLRVDRPRFTNIPGTAGRFHAGALYRSLLPLLTDLRRDFPFEVIDAEFFFPDGPAAVALGAHFGVPVSIKARGADIHHWGRGATARQVLHAGQTADGLLAVSEAMRNDIAALGIPAAKIAVHRTGIDRNHFHPRASGKARRGVAGPLILSVGALIERKGHAIVIDAVARLPGTTLFIAGDGPDRAKLEAQIATLNLGERVTLLGAVPHSDLPALFAAADVMALASASEGLANVWVEALASGTPIVITGAGGARETVDRPAAGRIVERTPEAFAHAIAELLLALPKPADVVAAADRFSWDTNASELRAHLGRLVAARD
jgi:glycosyltransferase involved in cell wall biosynthesis